jgi:surfactin synthase thioesterase subunit
MNTISDPFVSSPWFERHAPRKYPRLRLFCFAFAGGTAALYRRFHEFMPHDVDVCAVQLPGHGRRAHETPYDRLDLLLEALREAFEPYLDRPFALFGHSMGALIAYEFARVLRRHDGPRPLLLGVAGRSAPRPGLSGRALHQLPSPDLFAELRALNGTPGAALESEALMEFAEPLLRADFKLVETWEHICEPPLRVPIVAFAGTRDPAAPAAGVDHWRAETSRSFKSYMIPGDHFFIQSSQELVASILGAALTPAELRMSTSPARVSAD